MRQFRIVITVLLLVAAVSGCHRTKVIPKGKFAEISAEMLLTDQWLRIHPEVDKTTDTALVYDPIFRRYGYTTDDYLKSENHYMREPQKYSKIMREAAKLIDKEIRLLDKKIAREDYLESLHFHAAPSVKKVLARFSRDSVFHGWPRVMVNEDLAIYLTDYSKDTVYRGPEMIIREKDTVSVKADSLGLDSLKIGQPLKERLLHRGEGTLEPEAEGDPIDREEEIVLEPVRKKK